MTQILDGRIVRDKIAEKLKAEISRLAPPKGGASSKCKLVIIQVGNLPQSNTYIRQKVLFGQKIGAIVDHQKFPENISEKNLLSIIHNLNSDSSVTGIIVQLPIPDHLDKNNIIDAIDPIKDVDGQTATNIKLLFEGLNHSNDITNSGYLPATTKGILTLLDHYQIPVSGKHVVVVGRSSLVGKPTALAFLNRDATVTICHSKTKNLAQVTKNADILIVAAGQPKLITKKYVSKGQVVADVGINVIEEPTHLNVIATDSSGPRNEKSAKPETEPEKRKLVGDVDFGQVSKIVKAISPVPGGCGPMTVASLFQNLLEAYQRQSS